MSDRNRVDRRLAGTALLFSASICAVFVHSILGFAQSCQLLSGDYASHEHGLLAPLALAGLAAGIGAALLYLLHVADQGAMSLPWLARIFRSNLGWRTVAGVAICAASMLVAMETAEQFAAGHFDGILSAFGGLPLIALALILAVSGAIVGLLRRLCNWLADAHVQIAFAIARVLRDIQKTVTALFARSKQVSTRGLQCAWAASYIFVKRGPPALLA